MDRESGLEITVGDESVEARWVETNPETRDAVWEALPVEGSASKWGDELYFDVSVDVDPEETREEVPVGGVAYWPRGNALCFFWGPTPASRGDEPRAASPVALVARIGDGDADIDVFEGVEDGTKVRVDDLSE